MSEIHMGELLEQVIRRKGLNITDLALALNITRTTLYNWFKQEFIDQATMERISGVIKYDINTNQMEPIILNTALTEPIVIKDEAFWQDKYIDLLERYAKLLSTSER